MLEAKRLLHLHMTSRHQAWAGGWVSSAPDGPPGLPSHTVCCNLTVSPGLSPVGSFPELFWVWVCFTPASPAKSFHLSLKKYPNFRDGMSAYFPHCYRFIPWNLSLSAQRGQEGRNLRASLSLPSWAWTPCYVSVLWIVPDGPQWQALTKIKCHRGVQLA